MPDNPKDKRLSKLKTWWTLSEHAYNPFFVEAKKDLDFYLGGEKQWDSADLQKLKAEKRPALTFNHLLALINLVSGYQRQNRQDIKIYNRKGGSKDVAEILTEIIKHIHDNCYGDWETSMQFLMGIITGKGYLGVNINYDDDILSGDIVLENISPFRVYPDPFHERYDLSDAEFVFKIAWLPKSRINLVFPEKEKDLDGLITSEEDRQLIPYAEGDKYHDADAASTAVTEIEKYRYRVKEVWWREMKKQNFLVGIESGMVKQVDWPKERIDQVLKMQPSLRKISRVRPVLNLTTYVGETELQHVEDPLDGVTRFPIIPFFAYWLESNHFGIITQLKDPQREINKRVSQALHHLNQSANSGWIADDNALRDWSVLDDFGSKAGIVIKKKPGSYLEKITPTQVSDAHLTLAQAGKQNIQDVSGVNPALAGAVPQKGDESGILMELRRNQGLTSLESVFDNFRLSRQILGATLVDIIQRSKAYTKEEILTLVIDGEAKEIPINQKITEAGVDRVLNDLTVGKYKCVVSQSPSSPTIRAKNFTMLVEAVKAGFPIPPEVLLDASDLPEKDKIKQAIIAKQQAEAGMQAGAPAGMPTGAPI